MNYSFDWSALWLHRDLIVSGFVTTVELASISLVLATVLGIVIGTCGAVGSRGLRVLAIGWVELIRSVPLLIHMYIWYMALAVLKLPAFACAVLALQATSGPLAPNLERTIKQDTVGPLTTIYADGAPERPRYTAIDNMLKAYLSGSGTSGRMVRG